MKIKKLESGLVVPKEYTTEQEDLAKKYKKYPLVITTVGARKEIGSLFHSLINHSYMNGGGIQLDGFAATREKLVLDLAKTLLGNDWDCERYT